MAGIAYGGVTLLGVVPASVSAATTIPAGYVDYPAPGLTVSGTLTVGGWAVDLASTTGTGVDRVQVYVDGTYLGDAVYARTRTDISATYGVRFAPSGFLFVADVSAMGGGTHNVDVRARSTVTGANSSYTSTFKMTGAVFTPTATLVPTSTATPIPPGVTVSPTATPTATPRPATATPIPTSAPPPNFAKEFGVNAHLGWADLNHATVDVDRAQSVGMHAIRFDVQWAQLEPTAKGGWSPVYLAQLDSVVNLVASRGLRPVMILMSTPAWARGNTRSDVTPPTNVQDYADALGFLAARYSGTSGIAYEVWNEPNVPVFWDTPSGPDALVYARMLKASYASIKGAAPSAIVLGGSVAFNDQIFLQSLFAFGGIAGHYDGFALHPYDGPNAPDSTVDTYRSFKLAVEQTSQLMANYGDSQKPIWITEMGWSTNDVSDWTRAAYFTKAVSMVRAWPQVAEFMAYSLNQSQAAPDLGLISASGNGTSAWYRYGAVASSTSVDTTYPGLSIDSPNEWATGMTSLAVSGWAVDLSASTGTGVDRVQVFVDGAYRGDATYGRVRSDLVAVWGVRFGPSGYDYQLDVSGLSVGAHMLELKSRSVVSGNTSTAVRAINVVAIPTTPAGSMDSPPAGATVVGNVAVGGFAVDVAAATGSGIDRVQVYLDGVLKGTATYGRVRSDIAAVYGTRFGPSGYSYQLDLTGVAPGIHTLEARARSTQTGIEASYTRTVSVGP